MDSTGKPSGRQVAANKPKLQRTTFRTSRLLEFCSERELVNVTGHDRADWPRVILKELIDNALDACEEAGVAPEIMIKVDGEGITVSDNGPGIPAETVDGLLDYTRRVSSREAYVSPCRGAQGNALQSILPMPFVLHGEYGRVDIASRGERHEIIFGVDAVRREPVVNREAKPARNAKAGTAITVRWPDLASQELRDARDRFLQLAHAYTFLNPHLSLSVQWFNERKRAKATDPGWKKWRPSDPTSPYWYSQEDAERLLGAYVAHDQDHGGDRLVREVVREFRGLSGTAKQKAVLEETGLARRNLSDLVNGYGLEHETIEKLFGSMRKHSKMVKSRALGLIGEDHLRRRFAGMGCDMETFTYGKVLQEGEIPLVLEAAFAYRGEDHEDSMRRLVLGINWSAAISNPFRELGGGHRDGLSALLTEQKAGYAEPIVLLLHAACPRVRYTDRGKSAVVVEDKKAEAIKSVVERVTKKWARHRKAEEREFRRVVNRRDALTHSRGMKITEAAPQVLAAAYRFVSGPDQLPVKARQLYYAARGRILKLTKRETLDQRCFSQTIVRRYMEQHPESTADWDIVFDARGTFYEPHTGQSVPVGTLEVREYLGRVRRHKVSPLEGQLDAAFPTCGPEHRFSAVLFVEKEGFNELFRAVRLAERYDLAYVSTKGLSVGACRALADTLCGEYGIPLLVVRDFDKAGFSIVGSLQRDSPVYTFEHEFEVIDLGLRLEDVEARGLESEPVSYGVTQKGRVAIDPGPNLLENEATEEEVEFLRGERSREGYRGRRVELNAFTSPGLIEWLEGKLHEHGIRKVLPDSRILETAYRRAVQIEQANRQLPKIISDAAELAAGVKVPRGLRRMVQERLSDNPGQPWDDALADVARARFVKNGQAEG